MRKRINDADVKFFTGFISAHKRMQDMYAFLMIFNLKIDVCPFEI